MLSLCVQRQSCEHHVFMASPSTDEATVFLSLSTVDRRCLIWSHPSTKLLSVCELCTPSDRMLLIQRNHSIRIDRRPVQNVWQCSVERAMIAGEIMPIETMCKPLLEWHRR